VIKLLNVNKVYPRTGPALEDISLHVPKGEFVFLTGHSGSGKSTCLRLIHLAERPTTGEIRVSGFSSQRTSDREVWKVRRRVGFVFQDYSLLPGRTAEGNVTFALEVTGTPKKEIRPRAQRLLSQVGLAAKVGSPVHQLSGGEQQRVAIARALASEPLVLLADEPTGNLDMATGEEIMAIFKQLNADGGTIIVVTHEPSIAAQFVKQFHILDGRIFSEEWKG